MSTTQSKMDLLRRGSPLPADQSEGTLYALRHYDGLAMIGLERAALREVLALLVRMRSLAVRARWPATDVQARVDLGWRMRRLVVELDELVLRTKFHGVRLLGGELEMVGIQSRPESTEFIVVGLIDARPAALGLEALRLSTPHAASVFVSFVDAAIEAVQNVQRVLAEDARALRA